MLSSADDSLLFLRHSQTNYYFRFPNYICSLFLGESICSWFRLHLDLELLQIYLVLRVTLSFVFWLFSSYRVLCFVFWRQRQLYQTRDNQVEHFCDTHDQIWKYRLKISHIIAFWGYAARLNSVAAIIGLLWIYGPAVDHGAVGILVGAGPVSTLPQTHWPLLNRSGRNTRRCEGRRLTWWINHRWQALKRVRTISVEREPLQPIGRRAELAEALLCRDFACLALLCLCLGFTSSLWQ